MPPESRRRIGTWLALWAAMVLLLVLIGGATRLTESGLSITEWKPVTGVIPPLNQGAWEAEFARYQQIPEYQQLNQGMSLAQFQVIYLWEFSHRLWARLVGLALALPLLFFLWRRELRGRLAWRTGGILLLTGLQGAMGWYMVRSGLTIRTDVSQYRLAAHLALALIVYALAVWTAAELLGVGDRVEVLDPKGEGRLRRRTAGFVGFAFVTIVSGAFVAGLDAGHAWNTFPLMGGQVVPPGYSALSPWYLNASRERRRGAVPPPVARHGRCAALPAALAVEQGRPPAGRGATVVRMCADAGRHADGPRNHHPVAAGSRRAGRAPSAWRGAGPDGVPARARIAPNERRPAKLAGRPRNQSCPRR